MCDWILTAGILLRGLCLLTYEIVIYNFLYLHRLCLLLELVHGWLNRLSGNSFFCLLRVELVLKVWIVSKKPQTLTVLRFNTLLEWMFTHLLYALWAISGNVIYLFFITFLIRFFVFLEIDSTNSLMLSLKSSSKRYYGIRALNNDMTLPVFLCIYGAILFTGFPCISVVNTTLPIAQWTNVTKESGYYLVIFGMVKSYSSSVTT